MSSKLALSTLIVVTVAFLAVVGAPTRAQEPPPGTVVTYTPTDALFPNPERGFYHHTQTYGYTPLELTTLQDYRQNEDITLILRVFYLTEFVNSAISDAYLNAVQADFDTLRLSGLKAVVRFAYTDVLPAEPPWGDASKAQVLAHVAQLEPILQLNSDVIAAVQAGFIGVWGEWFYTDYFVDDPWNPDIVTPADWANRGEVLAAVLGALPGERMVQVRTPLIKQRIYGTGTGAASALPPADAHNGTNIARTGHHNDCFLASDTDFGTYADITEDKAYLAEETKYLPMGGETCNPNPPRSECAVAMDELARFHWSYVNADWHPDVITGWNTGGCLEEIKRRLGYRFALVQGTYPSEVERGDDVAIHVELKNVGWAAPFNPRPVELLLRNTTGGTIHRSSLPDDPRFWLPDGAATYSLDYAISTAGIPPGDHELLLNLPAPEPALYGRPEYSIQFANSNVWEASTGYNRLLHTLTVTGSVGGIAELPDVDEAPLNGEGQSGTATALMAGIATAITAGAVALGGAAWYARRRHRENPRTTSQNSR